MSDLLDDAGRDDPEDAERTEDAMMTIIVDRAEQLRDEMEASDRFDQTKVDMWGVRAIRRLAKLELDRPAPDAPAYEHEAYEHERAATMVSVATDLIRAASHSDVVAGEKRGQLRIADHATHETVSDHHHTAHWIRRQARRERAQESAVEDGDRDD